MKKAALFLLGGTAAAAYLSSELYKYAFCGCSSALFNLTYTRTHKEDFYQRKEELMAKMRAMPRRRHSIKSDRGEELVGYYYPCGEKPSGKIVFFIHGYRSDHVDTGAFVMESWHERGFDVFGCDHAAHGESGGSFIGFDFYERADCLKWLDFLIKEYGSDVKIILQGFSMGGATVMAMSDALPENVRFVIEDSGYTSAEDLLRTRLRNLYQPLRHVNRLLAGYDVPDTDVRPHLCRAKIPMLFVHGDADVTVPYEMGQELYRIYNGEKDCLFIPGGYHIEGMFRNNGEYMAKADAFIEKYF